MQHLDQIRIHLARLADAVNAGNTLAAIDATTDLMAARNRLPRDVSLPAPMQMLERL